MKQETRRGKKFNPLTRTKFSGVFTAQIRDLQNHLEGICLHEEKTISEVGRDLMAYVLVKKGYLRDNTGRFSTEQFLEGFKINVKDLVLTEASEKILSEHSACAEEISIPN